MARVALDLLGGDRAPGQVVDGALLAAEEPGTEVVLVGPPDLAAALLAERGCSGRLAVEPATRVVAMHEDPALAVRSRPDATVRVCARLVREGRADALVTVGSTGGAVAAAVLTLGRAGGLTRPALAVVVPAAAGPLVLLDAGATVAATPELLGQYAVAGAAYAAVRLGLAAPRVGLLSTGHEPGKGDRLRKRASAVLAEALAPLPAVFVGNVEGGDVPAGGRADVVVTDGFTGNVLLKGIEAASGRTGRPGGSVLLGTAGVVVVGHGDSTAAEVAGCVTEAAAAVRDGLLPRLAAALRGPCPASPGRPG